ncbi:MAG TPA: FprA family A-type flavoprotein, partial [Candidatus Scatomorpha merdipullorum]|nr:FprA family A-type flavoprotein [Candidatus Scatomorpha merdipullorum]
MHCTKKITSDLVWVGADDRRLAFFEGVYGVPEGVSYNSYLLLDEKTVLFDTVDKAVAHNFFENVAYALGGRKLDYLVVHHMEPDHAATIEDIALRYPEATIVCNAKIKDMLSRFFPTDLSGRVKLVKEGDTLSTGRHNLTFVMAPMVHWPEVMMSYDSTDGILFSADAFGSFGALNGRIFADEVDFMHDCIDEARRYYTNIVGKYGMQVQAVLKKAAGLDIKLVCPLHSFVWRQGFGDFLEKYVKWATYEPEEKGVLIAYASVYGHTENAANILAAKLCDRGVKVKMYDTSVTAPSFILSDAFKYSHLVFAATTYNAGIFSTMSQLLHEIAEHNLQNRKIALIENGSWAPTSGGLMRKLLEGLKGTEFIGDTLTLKSALTEGQLADLDVLADAIAESVLPPKAEPAVTAAEGSMDGVFEVENAAFN